MSGEAAFDPYGLLEALERSRLDYLVIGGFARVVHGSGEVTRGLDIVPAMRERSPRCFERLFDELELPSQAIGEEPVELRTRFGLLRIVPIPWGTQGYDELRRRSASEHLGRMLRPQFASTIDLARMLEESPRPEDHERLPRHRRMMELERQLSRHRGLSIER